MSYCSQKGTLFLGHVDPASVIDGERSLLTLGLNAWQKIRNLVESTKQETYSHFWMFFQLFQSNGTFVVGAFPRSITMFCLLTIGFPIDNMTTVTFLITLHSP